MEVLNTDQHLKNFFLKRERISLLTLDLGNTNPHMADFTDGELSSVKKLESLHSLKDLEKPFVVSSVTEQLETSFKSLWQDNSFCQMPLHYEKNQLGLDRLYQAAFIYHAYPNQEVILIDAGTFITVDHINETGFLGGYIYPGPQTFLSSYKQGKRLPTLDYLNNNHTVDKLPVTTEQAIRSAALKYIQNLCEGILNEFPNKKIILTGGQSKSLVSYLSGAEQLSHLIHYSLYFLYQEEQRIRS